MGIFYPLNKMQCVNVLQACCTKVFQGALQIQLCSKMQKGNGKTWIQMFSNTRHSIGIYERFYKVQKGAAIFEYF
jgi:hypothetical protein